MLKKMMASYKFKRKIKSHERKMKLAIETYSNNINIRNFFGAVPLGTKVSINDVTLDKILALYLVGVSEIFKIDMLYIENDESLKTVLSGINVDKLIEKEYGYAKDSDARRIFTLTLKAFVSTIINDVYKIKQLLNQPLPEQLPVSNIIDMVTLQTILETAIIRQSVQIHLMANTISLVMYNVGELYVYFNSIYEEYNAYSANKEDLENINCSFSKV